MVRVLGERAVAGADSAPLRLPGWDGDDVIVAPDADSLAIANPSPATGIGRA